MNYATSLDLTFLVFNTETRSFFSFLLKEGGLNLRLSYFKNFTLCKSLLYGEEYVFFCSKKIKAESSSMYEAEMRAVGEYTYEEKKKKEGDFLRIGEDITIQVFYAEGGRARVGVSAPRNVKIKKNRRKLHPERSNLD